VGVTGGKEEVTVHRGEKQSECNGESVRARSAKKDDSGRSMDRRKTEKRQKQTSANVEFCREGRLNV